MKVRTLPYGRVVRKTVSSSQALPFMALVVFSGCMNLDVVNQNDPDEVRALATPSDIESLIEDSFLSWFLALQRSDINMDLGVMSDTYTCSWGSFGMNYLSQEPRVEYDNRTTFARSAITEAPWFGLYGAISAASDGIRTIRSGRLTLGKDNERALGFGKLVQGLSHGFIALMFDQGFILDEDVDVATEVLDLQPYATVMDAAIAQLNEAIAIFDANTFTLPDDWIGGKTYTSAELSKITHSFIARYMAEVARDRTERAAVDWATVVSHLDKGITEPFGPTGDGNGRTSIWHSRTHWYAGNTSVWQRADYKLIGPSDVSTGYTDWLAKKPADRDEFILQSSDLRIWDGTLDADGVQNPGTQYEQIGPTGYPGGKYQRSRYGHTRFDEVRATSNGVQIVLFRPSEIDFLRAEAMLHMGGSTAAIAALLDKTHVVDGGYPTTAGLAAGSISDTPNPRHDAGTTTLWSVLKYEKNIDLLGTWSGLQFWDKRGWGELTSLTLLHFPVPALDLEILQLGLYSFGGGGIGSAPKVAAGYHGEDSGDWKLTRD